MEENVKSLKYNEMINKRQNKLLLNEKTLLENLLYNLVVVENRNFQFNKKLPESSSELLRPMLELEYAFFELYFLKNLLFIFSFDSYNKDSNVGSETKYKLAVWFVYFKKIGFKNNNFLKNI